MTNKQLSSMTTTKDGLISIVIPCFNQAHFLGEAIESVLAQTYPSFEIIVVDDGSTDNTAAVATGYPGVQYFRQSNQGLAAARNTGLRHSRGDYLIFLDADDRLLPVALESGFAYLRAHPKCAFVSGHYRLIAADGTVLPTWRERRVGDEHCFTSGPYELVGADGKALDRWPQQQVVSDHYTVLLQRNYIAMHATVMYRRGVFEAVGGYNPSLRACEDYELYLRIARQFPIACHDHVVAEYRQHGANMTRNSTLMLNSVLGVLQAQGPYIQGNAIRQQAYALGEKFWRKFYVKQAVGDAWLHLRRGNLKASHASFHLLWQYTWQRLGRAGQHILATARYHLDRKYRRLARLPVGRVNLGALRRISPLGGAFKNESRLSVEQYYLYQFLEGHAADLQGCCLEIGNGDYLRHFERDCPNRAGNLTHPLLPTAVPDLQCAEQLPPNAYHCILLPQVFHRVYDLKTALETVYRLLKPGGILLLTVPGIPLDPKGDTTYWAFTPYLVHRLLAEVFPPSSFSLNSYGNVLAATSLLHGLEADKLRSEELDYCDPHYQVLIGGRAVKAADSPAK